MPTTTTGRGRSDMADEKAFDWAKIEVGATPASQPPRETIVVHCANGHRLVVPATLAGKRGKCSKCQASFQIPAAAEGKPAAAPSPVHLQPGDGHPAPVAEPPSAKAVDAAADMFVGIAGPAAATPPAVDFQSPGSSQGPADVESPRAGAEHRPVPARPSIADLVSRLWEELEHGGDIELHLTSGNPILPKWFESRWSAGTHGLFATEAVDGSITLTAVAWDSIQKVVIRNVDGLPDGMFE